MSRELDTIDEELSEYAEHINNLALLTDVALGDFDDAKDVYLRHGLTKEQWQFLNKTQVFKSAVSRVRAELERTGKMTQAKARLMADDLMGVVYKEAMDLENPVPLEKRLEVLKVFAKLADIEPKSAVNSGKSGPSFSIQINIPTLENRGKAVEIIEAKCIEDSDG